MCYEGIIKTCQKFICWRQQNFGNFKIQAKITCVQKSSLWSQTQFSKIIQNTSNFRQIMSWVTSFIFFLQNWSSTIIQDSATKFANFLNLQISSNFIIVNSYLTEDYVKPLEISQVIKINRKLYQKYSKHFQTRILSFPWISFSMIQFKAIFAYQFITFRTIVPCFFYVDVFHLYIYIHRAYNIFSKDVCSLGNAFLLNALHSFLVVIFQHYNMKSHRTLCSQVMAEQADVSVLLCTICEFDIWQQTQNCFWNKSPYYW